MDNQRVVQLAEAIGHYLSQNPVNVPEFVTLAEWNEVVYRAVYNAGYNLHVPSRRSALAHLLNCWKRGVYHLYSNAPELLTALYMMFVAPSEPLCLTRAVEDSMGVLDKRKKEQDQYRGYMLHKAIGRRKKDVRGWLDYLAKARLAAKMCWGRRRQKYGPKGYRAGKKRSTVGPDGGAAPA